MDRAPDDIDQAVTPAAARELHRKTLLLVAIFMVVHFLMLTIRAAVVEIDHQVEIARARAILVPLSALLFYATYWLLRQWRGRPFAQQAGLGAAASTVAALIHATIWARFLEKLDGDRYPDPGAYVLYQSFYWYLFYFSWTTAYLALCYSITVREQERRAATLLAEAQNAKIQALRYQINPHFLFNTLNSIATLIGEDRAKAEAMVLNLSEFFRSTLAADPVDDVRLADEVALQQLYLEIERVRFPDRLTITLDIPAELAGARVPSLILQPLVENAIKHGVARSEADTHVAIRAARLDDRLLLCVTDDAVRAGTSVFAGTGIGLDNVRNRLKARYGDAQSLVAARREPAGFAAEIILPLTFR